MKKKRIRILSLFLIVLTLVGAISLPVSAAYGYSMVYTITYKTKDGTVLGTKNGTVDSTAEKRNALRIQSPSYDGYLLSSDNDAVVTGDMISWSFPASNYVRNGTGAYTVYYEKAYRATARYLYASTGRNAASNKTATGKKGDRYYFSSPRVTGYTASKTSVSGYFPERDLLETIYYFESTYTISFNANGGSGAPSSITKKHFSNATLPNDKPYRSGYTFLGWSTNSNASSASYQPGATYSLNGSTTLYAVWKSKTYSISYNANGGTGAPPSQTKHHGIKLLIPSIEPTRSGYTFLGWATSATATSPTYQPGGWYYSNTNQTFYAVWEKDPPATYTVSYDANGGSGAPGSQTKTADVALTLSSVKPYRSGYTFKGWATNKYMPGAQYQPGGKYTANVSVTLYAVWEKNAFTVSYNANGGSNAPASQTKTRGRNLTLSSVVPTRANHAFLGWATSADSTTVIYLPGESYSDEADITLYAVWQERNYDFSASSLTVTPDEIEQYGKVTVKFRLDSWDRNLPYEDIPVEVLLNGTVIYSTTVNFTPYGVQNIVFDLNVGASFGEQTLVARINWADHNSETRTGDNTTSATFSVRKVVETSASTVSANGEYTEGTQVISSFYVGNEGSSDILPDDDVSFNFLVYCLDSGTVKTVSQQTWDKVVIPAGGRNLVYFKWTVPMNSAGTTYYCQGTVTHAKAGQEQNSDNNTTEFAVVATAFASSQTPNTRFEKTAPAGYSPNANPPTAKSGSATWNMWVYEGGRLVLKSYGVTVGSTDPTVAPGSGCLTAEKIGTTWKLKSGYGIALNWNPALVAKSGCLMPGSDAYTNAQSVYATFPEFGFSTASEKYRTLEKVGNTFQFISNPNADKSERVHFIPVYVANGNYTVSVTATQIWTPAGMITAVRNANTLTIEGSIYDDHYVGN